MLPPLYKHKEKGNKNKKSLLDTMLFYPIKSSLAKIQLKPSFIERKTHKIRIKPSHKAKTLARESKHTKSTCLATSF